MSYLLFERIVADVGDGGSVNRLLAGEIREAIASLRPEELREEVRRSIARPQRREALPAGRSLMNPCLTVMWLDLFERLGLPGNLSVFEPCAGASEPVILAAEIYTEGRGSYVTVNLNRPLAAQLREKAAKASLSVRIIEENASEGRLPIDAASADIACFHHAVNDLLQTAVSEPRGMDTRTIDWWPNERQMIEWLAEDERAGRLDERARPALIGAVRNAVEIVKPGGFLLFDHWTFEAHRELEWFPWELFNRLIPMAREWIVRSNLPLREIPLEGRDPQWWMGFRREE